MFGHAHLHRVIVGLFRRTWLFALVTAIVCAVISAHAVAALIDARMIDGSPRPEVRDARLAAPAAAVVRRVLDGDPLVARNMFCSTCTPARDEPGSPVAYVPDAVLIATAIGERSRATLRVRASDAQGDWEVGETVPGLGRLDRVQPGSIDIIDTSGRRGRLSLLGAATPGHDQAASAPAAEPPAPAWAGRIRKLDDHTYEVDRDLVRELVGAGAKAGGGAVIRPVTDGKTGAMTGLRVIGVRDDSLPAALGLRTGDALTTVNGTAITSANVLLELYAHVDQLNVIELDGTRGTGPLALTLHMM
jgi:hypothetical protein